MPSCIQSDVKSDFEVCKEIIPVHPSPGKQIIRIPQTKFSNITVTSDPTCYLMSPLRLDSLIHDKVSNLYNRAETVKPSVKISKNIFQD